MTTATANRRSSILDEMFFDLEGEQGPQALRLEAYKTELNKSAQATDSGRVRFDMSTKTIQYAPEGYADQIARIGDIEKAIGAGATPDLLSQLAEVRGWIQKDWTTTVPVSSGLMPYDLRGPALQLWPRDTPLRNSIPREEGQGNAREFKRILSITNAGVPGGAADALPFFSSQSTTSSWGSGPVVLNRPPKITYTGDSKSVPYMELGVSDSVSFVAQFKGVGFDDLRALSRTAALWSHLLGEEKADLYARGTATGYAGVVSAPTGVTATGGASGGTIPDASYFVYAAAYTGQGFSAVSTVANTGALAGGNDNTITVALTEPAGALAYGIWIGTTTGIANAKFQGIFPGQPILITSYNAAGTVTAGTDSSASALAYDGFLTVAVDPAQTGYLKRLNGVWSTTNPGTEIDTALRTMFVNNGANPDQIWMDGASRQSLGQLLRTAAAAGYRTNVVTGNTNTVMSTTVVGFANGNTGKVLDIDTHRFMPVGNCFIRSMSIPIPNSHVAAPSTKVNVQDYMALDWPLLQMSYDISTYQIGTLVHQAPAWNGLITGIQ